MYPEPTPNKGPKHIAVDKDGWSVWSKNSVALCENEWHTPLPKLMADIFKVTVSSERLNFAYVRNVQEAKSECVRSITFSGFAEYTACVVM